LDAHAPGHAVPDIDIRPHDGRALEELFGRIAEVATEDDLAGTGDVRRGFNARGNPAVGNRRRACGGGHPRSNTRSTNEDEARDERQRGQPTRRSKAGNAGFHGPLLSSVWPGPQRPTLTLRFGRLSKALYPVAL